MNKKKKLKNINKNRRNYASSMKKAAKDKEFIKRTMECQRKFDSIE